MSYLNRVWMAATVAVINGPTDHHHKLSSGLRSLHHGKKRFSSTSGSGVDPADLRPLYGVLESDCGEIFVGEERRNADESIRQVMYMNCWGPS